MTYEKMAKRAKQLADLVFGKSKINIEYHEIDKCYDGDVIFDGHIGITQVNQPGKTRNLYQVFGVVYDPGVRYFKDGSGEPPSADVVEIGEPYQQYETAVVEALKYVLEKRLEDYLIDEYEDKFAKDIDDWDNDKDMNEEKW